METLIALALLILAVWIGIWAFGLALKLFVTLAIGLIIGMVARAILPGGRSLGLFATAVAGIVGSMIGGFLGNNVLHVQGFFATSALSVACAGALIALWAPRNRLPRP
jgi:uncharacterized membrane protein YeaQ/YmgE (transglycosylase-associated protein family)